MERKVIVIVGATCSGKTKVSIELAKRIKGEIISADSRQFYKHLTIGTAKPNNRELAEVKHYLVDTLNPDVDYNASRFERDAIQLIDQILLSGKIPVVVGGSGLYIKALIDGIMNTVETDPEYRDQLYNEREKFGNEYLYERLKKLDPECSENMLPQNWKRVIRSLEVIHLTGSSIEKYQSEYKRENNFSFHQYGLNWPREVLYENIDRRVDKMISTGLIDEVKSLLNNGYTINNNALRTVGYKEIISFLDGKISLEEAVYLIKRNTRRFAKRQLTWFRKDSRIKWIDVSDESGLTEAVEEIFKSI